MTRWDVEQLDHVFENTTWHPGPIIRSRVVDSEVGSDDSTDERGGGGVVTCPTCGERFPSLAAACPEDGTLF
jgi:hypothetical protein